MSTNAELNLSTVVDEISKRLNRLPGTSLVHDIRQLLTNAVDNPASAKALVAEAVDLLGKVSTNTLGHRQIVDDAIGILTATILGEPAEISEQAAKTIETLGSADDKTSFETILDKALDVNQEWTRCEGCVECEDMNQCELHRPLTGVDVNQDSEACQNCDCEPFACKETQAAIEDDLKIETKDTIEPVITEEQPLVEIVEEITVTQFSGKKTKVTKKFINAQHI
jgi:hypothetical protein